MAALCIVPLIQSAATGGIANIATKAIDRRDRRFSVRLSFNEPFPLSA